MIGYDDEKMTLALKWLRRRKERNLLERMRKIGFIIL
jgi:hypothetical protein